MELKPPTPARIAKRKKWMAPPTGPSKTKKEFALDSDINVIMARYVKTGTLPQTTIDPNSLNFADVSQFGTFQENHEKVLAARNHFAQYPAEVREAMHNDPARMQKFFADPDNYALLRKHNLIREPQKETPNPVLEELKTLNKSLAKPKKQDSPES